MNIDIAKTKRADPGPALSNFHYFFVVFFVFFVVAFFVFLGPHVPQPMY
jgi:hypothetical protein